MPTSYSDEEAFVNNHSKFAVWFHFEEPITHTQEDMLDAVFVEVFEPKWRADLIAAAAHMGITLTPRTY